jgi:hypothetical protein
LFDKAALVAFDLGDLHSLVLRGVHLSLLRNDSGSALSSQVPRKQITDRTASDWHEDRMRSWEQVFLLSPYAYRRNLKNDKQMTKIMICCAKLSRWRNTLQDKLQSSQDKLMHHMLAISYPRSQACHFP